MVTHSVLRTIPVGQVLRHARATDVINVHVTLDRDVLVLAVKTPVKTTAFIMRDGDTLAFLSLSNKSIVFIPGLLCSRFEIYLKFHIRSDKENFNASLFSLLIRHVQFSRAGRYAASGTFQDA